MNKRKAARWVLLAAGLVAIIALTGMNVYSLYTLRDTMVLTEKERTKAQLEDVTQRVREKIREPFWGFNKLRLERVESQFEKNGNFPEDFKKVLQKASESDLFTSIYHTPKRTEPCQQSEIYKYDPVSGNMITTSGYSDAICDGVGLVRTKAKIQVDDYEYSWNNIVEFDTDRTMNIALINLTDRTIIGFLTFIVDKDYLVNDFIEPLLVKNFGKAEDNGVGVWLHDWVKDKVLATNDPSLEYDYKKIDFRQNFPNFFSNWNIKAHLTGSQAIVAYNASLVKNLIVLGAAVLLLFGALLFMFVTAQRERQLAQRQASFLANVTHELKTPLAVMQAAGENIADGRVSEGPRLQKYGDHIYNEAVRLKKMIEKLLDVAKVDAGQTLTEPAPFKLHELLDSFIYDNREYIEAKGFKIKTEIPQNLPYVMIDPNSLETILSNLTENAIKYSSEEKKITFGLKKAGDKVRLYVSDTGIGIASDDQKYIFDKFYRVEDTLTATTKGHGLGLSIVKNHVLLNGGTIEVESTPQKGTTFYITFPSFADAKTSPEKSVSSGKTSPESQKIEYVG